MQQVKLEKVTLNVGVGAPGEKLENAKVLLERISGKKAIITKAKDRNPTWKTRKGDNIGAKVTLRGKPASEVLAKALDVLDNTLQKKSFDKFGNLSFGVKEYIDFPGMKYDPKIGMMGFDVSVTLQKPGKRISRRKVAKSRVNQKQRVSSEEAMRFMESSFKISIEQETEE